MSNYVMKLYTVPQYIEPRITEEETVVMHLTRHFRFQIAETITIQNIKTMEGSICYLNKRDRWKYWSNWQNNSYSEKQNGNNLKNKIEHQKGDNNFNGQQKYFNRNIYTNFNKRNRVNNGHNSNRPKYINNTNYNRNSYNNNYNNIKNTNSENAYNRCNRHSNGREN